MRKKEKKGIARQLLHNENGCSGQINVAQAENGDVVFYCAYCAQMWRSVYTKGLAPNEWRMVDDKKDETSTFMFEKRTV